MKLVTSRLLRSTADAEDLRQAFEDISGIDFETFFQQWYYGEGFPEYDVNWNWENGSLFLEIDQTPSAPSATPVFNDHFDHGLELGTGQDTILRLDGTSFPVLLAIPFDEVVDVSFDPQDWTLDEPGRVRRVVTLSQENFESEHSFRVSPNPAKGGFRIDGVNAITEYTLVDVTGRIVQAGDFIGSTDIQRAGLPSGMYLLSLSTNGRSQHKRIVFE